MSNTRANRRAARAILFALFAVLGSPGSALRADANPVPSPHTALNLRASAGIVDPARGFPRPPHCDRGLYVEIERASHLADAWVLRIGLRPDDLRPTSVRRTRSIAETSLGFRHLLLTDHMAGKWFMEPWLGLGAGIAVEGAVEGGFGERRPAWMFRSGLGMDFSVSPGFGFFMAWEHAGRSRMLFHRKRYDADHQARIGLAVVLKSGGRPR